MGREGRPWSSNGNGGGGGGVNLTGQAFGPSTATLLQRIALGPVRYIDPAGTVTGSSDSNTGANPTNSPAGTGPIRTTAHLNALLFFRFLTGESTTITYLSDDTSGTPLDLSTLDMAGTGLTFQGEPSSAHVGGTINGGAAINPAAAGGGQRQEVTVSDGITDWSPYVPSQVGGAAALPVLLNDTTASVTAWVMGSSESTAFLSRPLDGGFAAGAITNGDSYALTVGTQITIADKVFPLNGVPNFFDFSVLSCGTEACAWGRCSFNAPITFSGNFNNCCIAESFAETTGQGTISLTGGGWITHAGNSSQGQISCDLDPYVTGTSLVLSNEVFPNLGIVTNEGGAGLQVQDMTDTNGAVQVMIPWSIATVAGAGGNPLLWGNGNIGPGVTLGPGATFTMGSNVPPSIIGAAANFAFAGAAGAGLVTVGRTFNEATGTITESGGAATRTTTWAHFAAAIASGGFNFAAWCVSTGARVVGL